MPNESSTLPVLPRFGDPDSWAANVATKQDVADAKLAATSGSTTQTSIAISGTGGAGFISLPTQSSAPAAPASGFALYANATGKFSWRNAADTYSRSFEMTATANRTFTLPDASFTFAGQNLANTFSVAQVFSANGALSAPAVSFTGTPVAGGTSTTTKPLVLVETAGATSTGWNTSGTMFGINSSGGSLLLFDFQANGSSRLSLSAGGNLVQAAAGALQWLARGILTSPSAGAIQLGNADTAAPVAQTLSVQSVVAGTSNTAGVNFTIKGSAGTGTGAGGSIIFQVAPAGSTGSSQNAYSTALTLSNTSLLATFGGAITAGGSIQTPSTSAFYWGYRSVVRSPSDSVITLLNNAETSFDRLQFGGTTASFGAIARNGAGIKIVLASSSATLSDLTCSTLTTQGYTVATLPAAGTAGRRAHVTDALAPAFLAAVVGGGAVTCPVFDDGSAWVVG